MQRWDIQFFSFKGISLVRQTVWETGNHNGYKSSITDTCKALQGLEEERWIWVQDRENVSEGFQEE